MVRGDDRSFVGRTRELAEIAESLADPATSGVVLVGEGGVGKTRLARHALRTAEASGFATATVLATAAASTIPLGALEPIVGDELGPGTIGGLRSARRRLMELAHGAPLVLLVDDAHLLDPASATLLLQLAGDDAVFVLVTVRAGQPVPDPVTALWKDAGARRIDVEPLGLESTEALLHAVLGDPVAIPARNRLVTLSRGVPMALRELVDATRRSGSLVRRDGIWCLDGDVVLSDRLADLVELRLADTSAGERDALVTVAMGDPLPMAVARALMGGDVLHALEDRGLVSVRPGDDEVMVSHPLYGEVGIQSLGELHRRALLTELADATERCLAPSPATNLRIALWRLDAGGAVDADLLLDGARTAYTANDHVRTTALARAAWEHAPSAEAGHLYGLALGRLARPDDAEAVLAAAAPLVADDRMRVLIALARSENLFRGLNDAAGALGRVEEAEAAVADRSWRDELVAHRAMLILQAGDPAAALALVEPLLAEGAPDRPFVKAAYVAGPALAHDGRTDEAATLAQRALPIHERVWAEDLFQTEPAVHHVTAMLALIESGQLLEAEAYADLAVQVAAESGESYGLAYMSMLAGLVALRRGRVRTARRRCRDAVPLFRDTGYLSPLRWVLGGAATADALLGNLDAAREALAVADELTADTPVRFNEGVIDEARGWVHVAEGDFAAAKASFADGAARARGDGERSAAVHLLHTLARVGDAAAVVDELAELVASADGALAGLRLTHVRALATGDGDGLDAVAERFSALGADLYAAEGSAEAVRAHRRDGDQRAATRSARAAEAYAARCEGARTPGMTVTATVDPLTDREREVALLAAGGMSSKDIAARLVLSRRTVDNHLQRVFAKLGISKRADLPEALGHDPG